MSVCLLITTDRPDCLARSLPSLGKMLPEPDQVVIVNDAAHQLGFTGAVAEGWRRVLATKCDWVFHAEDDFIYNEPVDLERMIACLQRNRHLTQMTLKRQPVNEEECAAGGIVEAHPEQYVEMHDGTDTWTETDRFLFSTNPSVYSARLCDLGWPDESESEGRFGALLRYRYADARCGIWGGKFDPPRVEHIGVRVGCGY